MANYRIGNYYDNCLVLAKNGQTSLFRCKRKRAEWYLRKRKAELVRLEPFVIRLNFEPSSNKFLDNVYYSEYKQNQCVVCGVSKKLTGHHLVPACYIKYFPDQEVAAQLNGWHFILPVCSQDHKQYEHRYAKQLHIEFAETLGIPQDRIYGLVEDKAQVFIEAIKAASALHRHGEKIPVERKQVLLSKVVEFFGHSASISDIVFLCEKVEFSKLALDFGYTPFFKHVVEKYGASYLTSTWIEHFVHTMKPKCLPKLWKEYVCNELLDQLLIKLEAQEELSYN